MAIEPNDSAIELQKLQFEFVRRMELQKLQFDYAWKWFSYHADQRVKMFNFMLIALGIFATAIVNSVAYKMASGFTAALCFVASVLALAFWFLDTRNRDLVELGEELLTDLDRNVIFGEGIAIKDRGGEDIQIGILLRQSVEDYARSRDTWPIWGKRVQKKDWLAWVKRLLSDACHGRHRVWLRFVAILMCALFFGAGIWILNRPQ
jgi:hypothetical protein